MTAEVDQKLLQQLYSRQRYAVGAEAQKKYGATAVAIVGLEGAGCEIAKNLILSGVRQVTLVDNRPITFVDLATMFMATEDDIGKPRAATLAPRLAELNRLVAVVPSDPSIDVTAVPAEVFATHQVALYVNAATTGPAAIAANKAARANGCKFVAVETRGVAGAVFSDGGEDFTIIDARGEDLMTCIVTDFDPSGVVYCQEDKPHDAEVGDSVYFSAIQSPAALNTPVGAPAPTLFKIVDVMSPSTFKIDLPEALRAAGTQWVSGAGYVHVSRQPQTAHYKSLEAALAEPSVTMVMDAETKPFDAPEGLLRLLTLLHTVAPADGSIAAADAAAVAAAFVSAAEADAESLGADLVTLARLLAPTVAGSWTAMACYFGGIAAQEVLKLASGKYTPIDQWFLYDSREAIATVAADADRTPAGGRYDGQILIFGRALQERIQRQSVFIVGAGALGSEFIKNFALMGVGTAGEGRIVITDMDSIEMSNLSRQLLFRTHHIGQPKATVAAEAAKGINSAVRIHAITEKVAPETEHIFTADFWESVDVVCNALDNLAARRYVDGQCVQYKRPLFESGTLGAKCNMQSVIPFVTVSYSSTFDPPEKSIPLCTLKNFPNSIDHTIQWARDAFEEQFAAVPRDVASFAKDPAAFSDALDREPSTKSATIAAVAEAIAARPSDLRGCLARARSLFDRYFDHTIQQLLFNFPADKVDEKGEKFWVGAKKAPTAQRFDAAKPLHMDFIIAAAHLYAAVYGAKAAAEALANAPRDELAALAASIPSAPFTPKSAAFVISEKDTATSQAADASLGPDAPASLPDPATVSGLAVTAEEFEKDNDDNHHIDFITATSNLRAAAYNIPPADREQTKLIAGKIIPAMVTTTSYVTGAVVVEATKYLCGERSLANFRDLFTNLALTSMIWSEPQPVKGTTYTDTDSGQSVTWSLWDRFDVDEGRDLTLQQLITLLETRYNLDIFMASLGDGKMLYSSFAKKKDRMAKPMAEVLAEMAPPKEGVNDVTLVVTGSFGDADADIPTVRYRFRNFRAAK